MILIYFFSLFIRKNGRMPLHYAQDNGNQEIVDLLVHSQSLEEEKVEMNASLKVWYDSRDCDLWVTFNFDLIERKHIFRWLWRRWLRCHLEEKSEWHAAESENTYQTISSTFISKSVLLHLAQGEKATCILGHGSMIGVLFEQAGKARLVLEIFPIILLRSCNLQWNVCKLSVIQELNEFPAEQNEYFRKFCISRWGSSRKMGSRGERVREIKVYCQGEKGRKCQDYCCASKPVHH